MSCLSKRWMCPPTGIQSIVCVVAFATTCRSLSERHLCAGYAEFTLKISVCFHRLDPDLCIFVVFQLKLHRIVEIRLKYDHAHSDPMKEFLVPLYRGIRGNLT